jgi:hypothetical protein
MGASRELSEFASLVSVSSGNVGIGTSSPDAKLRINGSATVSSQVNVAARIGASGDSDLLLGSVNGNTPFVASQGAFPLAFYTNASERMRLDSSGNLQFNSGYGSVATAYGCRAWVNFNGTGTVAIRASGNVSSITDNGTGDYTVNFTNALPDANYCACFTWGGTVNAFTGRTLDDVSARSTTAIRVATATVAPASIDVAQVSVAIFR